MKVTCDVISDLMPLVQDGVATHDSMLLVEEHIKHCSACRSEYESDTRFVRQEQVLKDEKIVAAIKRSVFMTQWLLLIIGTVVGVAMTNSMAMFYNLILMPIVGALAVWMFKEKWYIIPLAVFFFTYVWQLVQSIFAGDFVMPLLLGALYMGGIYLFLMFVGAAIAGLLNYAFHKGENNE